MPFYEMYLKKRKTYFWDEDDFGRAIFHATDDEDARKFVATVVQRINRRYWRIGNQKNVFVEKINLLAGEGYLVKRVPVCLKIGLSPARGFGQIRKILEAFYPKTSKRRGFSLMTGFTMWKPRPFPL